jgi:heme o synthase
MSVAIAFSAVAGYILCSHALTWSVTAVFTGVLFLAGAASALNQFQERNLDALMIRTRNRPIPSELMKPGTSIIFTIIFGFLGSTILYFFTTPTTAALGIFNIFWYNMVYTPLKRKTPFVVIIGAVTGAIPPMMGWTAAGGYLLSPEILFIASFMFFWQIPHFFLLLLRYKEDYARAGFRSVSAFLSDKQVEFIVFAWILGTSVSTLFFPMYHIISGEFLISGLVLLNIMLIIFFYRTTFNKNVVLNLSKAFRSLYLYQLMILVILIVQSLK